MDKPILFISRSFEKGELHKDIVEKELLAIHFSIKTFAPYVMGKHFTVRSDHKPLVRLYKMVNPSSKLTRIRLDLEEFNFTVEHIPGKENVVADALSRISINDLKKIYENTVTMLTIQAKSNFLHISDFSDMLEGLENRSMKAPERQK